MSTSDTDDKVDVLDYSNVAPVIRTTLRLQTLGLLSNALLFVDCLLATNPLQKVFNQHPNKTVSARLESPRARLSLHISSLSIQIFPSGRSDCHVKCLQFSGKEKPRLLEKL